MAASGNSGSEKNIIGSGWQSELVYVTYEGESVSSRTCYNLDDLERLIKPITPNAETEGTVIKLVAYAIDLAVTKFFKPLTPILTHHFIKLEADNGLSFTFEKDKNCQILP